MTVSGSIFTRVLIDRKLIYNAILDHFQIALFYGRINRIFIPLTLFLLSRPLEQLEFIRPSNLRAESCVAPPIRPQRFILPRKLQSRYRRHLFYFKLFPQITRARRSLYQLSRLCIHFVQEFQIIQIQSRKNVLETNIVVIYNHVPQRISLTNLPLPRSRHDSFSRHHRQLFFALFSFNKRTLFDKLACFRASFLWRFQKKKKNKL